MKVIVVGKSGQLALELEQTHPSTYEVTFLSSEELDIRNLQQVEKVISECNPDFIINASAYTAVDNAEADQEQAYAVNALGVKYLAQVCKKIGAKMIHVSTDFVFDGEKNTPYAPTDMTNPVSVYGESKLAGERYVQSILADQASIVRTAWVYSEYGNNFVKTMLRLMSEKSQLGVVYDQVGTPTWAKGLAKMIWLLAERMYQLNQGGGNTNIYHWTDAGVTSWYDFAIAIQEIGFQQGLLDKKIPIRPIPASAYPTPAKRPSFSVLDKTGVEEYLKMETQHWREALKHMLSAG